MNVLKYPALRIGIFLLITVTAGCFGGIQLTTEGTGEKGLTGTYDLYLYGCLYPSDIENVAILVDPNSSYRLEIYAFDTRYKIRKGLSPEKAIAEANAFIRCSMKTVWQSEMRRIVDDQGRTFGYDLRPIYMPYEIKVSDAMRMNYRLKDGKVTAYIRLAPGAEDDPGGSGDGKGSDGK